MLLTLAGWTSPWIAEAFGVREDTVRLWRSDFAGGGIEALEASAAPGPAPGKNETALRVVTPLLEQPVADRRNWTIPRLRTEIQAREGLLLAQLQAQADPFDLAGDLASLQRVPWSPPTELFFAMPWTAANG